MPTVQESDRYQILKTAFGCVDRLTLDFPRSYGLFQKIQNQHGFKTIYFSDLPFIYVEGNQRKFTKFEKTVTTIANDLTNWDESFADNEIVSFIGEHITDFFNSGENPATMVLSIKEINIDQDGPDQFFSMLIDIFIP